MEEGRQAGRQGGGTRLPDCVGGGGGGGGSGPNIPLYGATHSRGWQKGRLTSLSYSPRSTSGAYSTSMDQEDSSAGGEEAGGKGKREAVGRVALPAWREGGQKVRSEVRGRGGGGAGAGQGCRGGGEEQAGTGCGRFGV